MGSLFETELDDLEPDPAAPLADRMRPRTYEKFVGQDSIVGAGRPLRKLIEQDRLPSIIFWGPPGSGKTTLAYLIARKTKQRFVRLSAVSSSVADVRKVVAEAKILRSRQQKGTILFVDEIHRFNKAQQDAFLPHVEHGLITLIGATTENPSFEVIGPLLSRCRVFVLEQLSPEDVRKIVVSALEDKERGLEGAFKLDEDAEEYLLDFSDGDARNALNLLEMASLAAAEEKERRITRKLLEDSTQRRIARYDKDREWHYNIISALHKSLRGSDPDASLYWLARMLEAGEAPLYIARRMVRFASEDVGNADPDALTVTLNAYNACHYLGMPECDLALAQAAIYLATAPKSNSTYKAYLAAAKAAKGSGDLPVPLHVRNAPTRLMKELGYSKDYNYPHAYEEHFVADEYLPEELRGKKFYRPGKFGFEQDISKRLAYWERLRKKLREKKRSSE